MISFHPNRLDFSTDAYYSDGFKTVYTDDPTQIGKLIGSYVTSPIVWKNGRRVSSCFEKCNWIGLDFDGEHTVDEILEYFKDYTHAIGLTQHHQLPKGKDHEPRDRLRVYL